MLINNTIAMLWASFQISARSNTNDFYHNDETWKPTSVTSMGSLNHVDGWDMLLTTWAPCWGKQWQPFQRRIPNRSCKPQANHQSAEQTIQRLSNRTLVFAQWKDATGNGGKQRDIQDQSLWGTYIYRKR